MIIVQTHVWDHTKLPVEKLEQPCLVFKLEGESLKEFQSLLNRSLNCAPEFGRDWFELSDKLEAFLKQI